MDKVGEIPIQAGFTEAIGVPLSAHERAVVGLRFRAQVFETTTEQQLASDVEALGGRIVSNDNRGILQRMVDAVKTRRANS